MKTKQVLSILNVLSWIIFLGLCVKTASLIFNMIIGLFLNPNSLRDSYSIIDFSEMANYNTTEYTFIMSLFIFIAGLQSYLFFFDGKIIRKDKPGQSFYRSCFTIDQANQLYSF